MKNNWVVSGLAVVFILIASFSLAGSREELSIDIPFAFYAGDQLLNAGKYNIMMGTGDLPATARITIKNNNGKTVCALATRAEGRDKASENSLRFNHYGEKHFLSGISFRKLTVVVPMSKLEAEIRSQMEKGQKIAAVAH
jgi:hypothetical protein